MANNLLTNLDLNKNELQNVVLHKAASAPSNPKTGQVYYNTNDNNLYRYNGTSWVAYQNQITASGILQGDGAGNISGLSSSATGVRGIDTVPTQSSSNLITSGGVYNALQSSSGGGVYYAVCSTGASTATKIVTIGGITELYTGLSIRVKFSNYHSSGTPKLNLNELGAMNIVKYGTTNEDPRGWRPGEVLDLVYDGANWVVTDGGDASTDYYGVTKLSSATNSTSTTMAATPSAVKAAYDLANAANEKITYGTTDLIAGTSSLATGVVYLMYE